MSYEGHIQALCQNGHSHGLSDNSYYCFEEESRLKDWRCSARTNNIPCNAPLGETNSVDDTNCDSYGERLLIEISPGETRVCDFGHVHSWTAARYRFSEQRYYYDSETGKKIALDEQT